MLSKSQFIRGIQCPKSLWLYKNKPELRSTPSSGEESLFEIGNKVGDLACQLFPDGIEIEFDLKNFVGLVQQTVESTWWDGNGHLRYSSSAERQEPEGCNPKDLLPVGYASHGKDLSKINGNLTNIKLIKG